MGGSKTGKVKDDIGVGDPRETLGQKRGRRPREEWETQGRVEAKRRVKLKEGWETERGVES